MNLHMVYYINQHLIADTVVGTKTWTTRDGIEETCDQVVIKTAGGATRVVDGKTTPTNMIICRHSISQEPGAKSRIRNTEGDDGRPRTRIQTSVANKYDDDVFIVALPYDGLVVPIDHDEDHLSIWRYLIQKSTGMNIEHNDRKYRRALYMVVSPHGAVSEDGWYTDSSTLTVKTIKSNLKHGATDTADAKWTVTIHTIRFGLDGAYEINTETETVPYDVYEYLLSDERIPIVEVVPPLPPKNGSTGPQQGKRGDAPKSRLNNGGYAKDEPADTNEGGDGKKKRRKKRKH